MYCLKGSRFRETFTSNAISTCHACPESVVIREYSEPELCDLAFSRIPIHGSHLESALSLQHSGYEHQQAAIVVAIS
jgi:hypothetical protein